MTKKKFVLVWAIPEEGGQEAWIMVRHRERGWELPGGTILDGEEADEAALRELLEEAGKIGVAKAIEENLIEGGSVVLIHIEGHPIPEPWKSHDDSIDEVGWCLMAPENTEWGKDEIEKIRSHDWSTSISLVS